MSKDLEDFTKYFMEGMKLGGGWADRWEQRQIQQAHNEMLAKQNATREARENRRLDLYGQSVSANVELARARAQRVLQPKAGGGSGGTPAASAFSDSLINEAADRGILVKGQAPPPAPAPAANVTVEAPDPQPVVPPASEPEVPESSKGGMIRRMAKGGRVRRYADGGAVATDPDQQAARNRVAADEKTVAAVLSRPSAPSSSPSPSPSGSADGATGSGGDAAGGVSGTGGVGGSATGGQGGSAAAGVGGDDGGTYARGGRVGVTQAIDTGTSGPGSGYGFRAAPPANSYRRRR